MNITYKKIQINDKEQLIKLINNVLTKLANKDFFISINQQELDEFFNQETCVLYGAYNNNTLVAIAKLDKTDKYDVSEIKEILNIKNSKVAEIGRYLCLEEYRRNGIMYKLQEILIEEARKLRFDYIVATAHPDNIASIRTLLKSEFELKNTSILANGYYRNIYMKKLKKI